MKRWKMIMATSLMFAMTAGTVLAQEQERQRQRRGGRQGRMRADDGAPKVGDEAPLFKLKSLDGKSETELASFKGEKPALLFFGSYT